MARQEKPTTFKQWIEDCQPITWLAHGLITLLAGGVAALLVSIWITDDPWLYPRACTGAAACYVLKEVYDFIQHWRAGNIRVRDWQGITPLLDGILDAGAPLLVAGTTWLPQLYLAALPR